MNKKTLMIGFLLISAVSVSCSQTEDDYQTYTAQEVIQETGQTEWDLFVLGDSDMDPAYMFYSEYFEEDLGVRINTHRDTHTETISKFLQYLEDEEMRALLSEAEIIVFNVPIVRPESGGACFDPLQTIESDGCFAISQDEFLQATQRIIREIKSIVGDRGAMIRLQNSFAPIKLWQGEGSPDNLAQDCLECLAAYWGAQAQIAADEDIILVDVFTAFHGEGHQGDPYESEYIASDNIHMNRTGAEAIAQLYRQAGYEYWKPGE
jgi:hypothetical protein